MTTQKDSFFLNKILADRNLTISIVTAILFGLYLFWVNLFIIISWISNDVSAYGGDKKMDDWFNQCIEANKGLLVSIFFTSTLIFYLLHKKWNYNSIRKRRYVEMISKFLLLWVLTNVIRGLSLAYIPDQESLIANTNTFMKIFFESEEGKWALNSAIKEKKIPYDYMSKWLRENTNIIRFGLFIGFGAISSVMSLLSCFVFGVWGYLSKKYSISYEQIE